MVQRQKQLDQGVLIRMPIINKEKQKKYNREAYLKNYPKRREIEWKRQGINFTHEQYLETFVKQDGRCWICGLAQEDNKMALCVDHNHTTGKVRGLLCQVCNKALGNFKDSIELLERAITYLKEND